MCNSKILSDGADPSFEASWHYCYFEAGHAGNHECGAGLCGRVWA